MQHRRLVSNSSIHQHPVLTQLTNLPLLFNPFNSSSTSLSSHQPLRSDIHSLPILIHFFHPRPPKKKRLHHGNFLLMIHGPHPPTSQARKQPGQSLFFLRLTYTPRTHPTLPDSSPICLVTEAITTFYSLFSLWKLAPGLAGPVVSRKFPTPHTTHTLSVARALCQSSPGVRLRFACLS